MHKIHDLEAIEEEEEEEKPSRRNEYLGIFFFVIFCIILFIPILGWPLFCDASTSNVKFYVTEASLTHFNLSTNNTLSYSLRVNITARNPNRYITISYQSIDAIARYKERGFGWASLTPFDQGHKNTTFLQPAVFEGESPVIDLEPNHVAEYKEETRTGIYNNIVVDLDVQFTAKSSLDKDIRFPLSPSAVHCRLRVPLLSNGKSAAPFNITKCKSSFLKIDYSLASDD